jgi:hypothetical protein
MLYLPPNAAAHEIAQLVHRCVGDPVIDARAAQFARQQAVLGEQRLVPRRVRHRAIAQLDQYLEVRGDIAQRIDRQPAHQVRT